LEPLKQSEQNLRRLTPVVGKVLREALDPGILELVSADAESAEPNCVLVVQTEYGAANQANVLRSPCNSLTVAVVDRTANLDEAAKALTSARMTFGGTSPYAPDIILVNEFVKKDFLEAVIKHSIQYMAAESSTATKTQQRLSLDRRAAPPRAEQKGFRTITSGSNGSILEVEER
jgi:hypothetical protein